MLLTALSTTSFQISKLSLQGEDVVASKAQEELDSRHGSQLRGPTGRQPAQLKELDGSQHPKLAGERGLICLFGQKYGLRYVNYELSTRHAIPLSPELYPARWVSQAPKSSIRYTACDPDGKTS